MFGDKDGRVKGNEVAARTLAEKKGKVLRLLQETGGRIQLTITKSRVARKTIDRWREEDPVFSTAWDETIELCVDELEAEAWRRANGYDEPIVYQGKIQGHYVNKDGEIVGPEHPEAVLVQATVRKFSDNLLMFMLKGHRPEKYRDGPGVKAGQLSEEEMDRKIDAYLARKKAREGELSPEEVM